MQGRRGTPCTRACRHYTCLTAFASSLLSRSPISPSLFGADANRVNGCACESEGRKKGGGPEGRAGERAQE